jgi:hypothetical protein
MQDECRTSQGHVVSFKVTFFPEASILCISGTTASVNELHVMWVVHVLTWPRGSLIYAPAGMTKSMLRPMRRRVRDTNRMLSSVLEGGNHEAGKIFHLSFSHSKPQGAELELWN